ncbi:UNVERIFIED_CONTAM: hypothetical protein RMT77_004592 [Armadillidium vulgare]
MSKLLEEEEEDDFYKTTYGGFQEEEEDLDYKSEVEQEDVVDSDFSIDENDEPVSDVDEEKDKKKRGRLITKAYKEPPKKPKVIPNSSGIIKKTPKPKSEKIQRTILAGEKKGIRKSTQLKSQETERRRRERLEVERKRSMRKKRRRKEEKLTQEELLEEAKLTEMVNIKSLEKYELAELDKKKPKVVRKGPTGPFIRFQSTVMPLIEEVQMDEKDSFDKDENFSTNNEENSPLDSIEKEIDEKENKSLLSYNKCNSKGRNFCERTFITFSDELSFRKIFKKSKPKTQQKNICPITRLPARYFDPVTQLPYATLQAFRVLREAYYQQLEDKGDPRNKEVAKWLSWRKEYKKNRVTAQSLKPTVTPLQTITPSSNTATVQQVQQNKSATTATSSLTSQQLIGVMQSLNSSLSNFNANSNNSTVTSVAAVAHILRTSGIGTSALLNHANNQQVNVVSSTSNIPRVNAAVTPNLVLSSQGSTLTGVQAGGTVQLVQALGSRSSSVAAGGSSLVHRTTPHMVVVSSAGQGSGGIHLVGCSSGTTINSNITNLSSLSNLLVQGNTGTNLLVQGASGGNVQIVQAGSGQGNLQVIQAGSVVQAGNSGQNVQVLQGAGRITLRPVANQTFTNLQSLLK